MVIWCVTWFCLNVPACYPTLDLTSTWTWTVTRRVYSVFVRYNLGPGVAVELEEEASVAQLKEVVGSQQGVQPELLRVLFAGKELKSTSTLQVTWIGTPPFHVDSEFFPYLFHDYYDHLLFSGLWPPRAEHSPCPPSSSWFLLQPDPPHAGAPGWRRGGAQQSTPPGPQLIPAPHHLLHPGCDHGGEWCGSSRRRSSSNSRRRRKKRWSIAGVERGNAGLRCERSP